MGRYSVSRFYIKRWWSQAVSNYDKVLEPLNKIRQAYEENGHHELAEQVEQLMQALYQLQLATDKFRQGL